MFWLKVVLSLLMTTAVAQEGIEYTVDGGFNIYYQLDFEPDGLSSEKPTNQNDFSHRFNLGVNFRSGEKFTARVEMTHAAVWGHTDFQTGSSADTGDSQSGLRDGASGTENTLLVNEAYGNWLVTDVFNVKAGRQRYDLDSGAVISSNPWELVPTSFEGAKLSYDSQTASLHILAMKIADWSRTAASPSSSIPASDPESNFYALIFDVNSKPVFVKRLDVHVMQINKDELNTGQFVNGASIDYKESLFRYGLSALIEIAIFDWELNYSAHTGNQELDGVQSERNAHMIDTSLGFLMKDWMDFRFYVGYHSDTGDDVNTLKNEGYDSFYYNRHRNAGLMDIWGWGNLTYLKAGFSFKPWDDIRFSADYYLFSRTSVDGLVNVLPNGELILSTPTTDAERVTLATQNDESDLGAELDLVMTREYEGGFLTRFRYSFFAPGAYLEKGNLGTSTSGASTTFNQFQVEVEMKF